MGSHRVQIRQKAAALDAEEAKRRFQVEFWPSMHASKYMVRHAAALRGGTQASTSGGGASEAQGPNMQRFVQQLSGQVICFIQLVP